MLADEIKHVHDHDLLDLIRQVRSGGRAGAVQAASAAASIASAKTEEVFHKLFPATLASDFSAATLPLKPMSEHHNDQEDYLWGV